MPHSKPKRVEIDLRADSKEFLTKDLQKSERIRKLTERDNNLIWSVSPNAPVRLYNARSAKKLPLPSLYALFSKIMP